MFRVRHVGFGLAPAPGIFSIRKESVANCAGADSPQPADDFRAWQVDGCVYNVICCPGSSVDRAPLS